MKVYVFYTPNVQNYFDLLSESAKGIEDLEIIPEVHNKSYSDCSIGATLGVGYKELCFQSHLFKQKTMKENIGSDIVFLDVDIVFNPKIKDFSRKVIELLREKDFLVQEDSNSHMKEKANLGIMAVKCNERSIALWDAHCLNVSKIPAKERKGAFPQIEFNDLLSGRKGEIKFGHLPANFGCRTSDCVIYHAIGVGDKMSALQNALKSFGQ